MCDLKQDCQRTRIVVRSWGVGYGVVVGGENQRGNILFASHRSNDIAIGATECMEWMANNVKAEAAELLSEIDFCVLEPAR